LKYGPDVEARDDDENTGLISMAWGDNPEGVAFFLEQQADVDALNDDEESALFKAVAIGNERLVQMLLSYGARDAVTKKGSSAIATPNCIQSCFLEAVRLGRVPIVEVFLRDRADIEIRNEDGLTALLIAL
jgi:ankyrin repeat protein